uniref:Xylulose kinase-1 n=1 Tax=Tanacetum cinerariifolium TaxID=118510 RepID=A0A6L2K3R6_TANCI|nr:xylulose kinase-1 [Tanacetum cinerariifolium]
MVVYLSKSDASEGFNQIIDFLNGRSIKYALTVNPNICVSCVKQFWTTIAVKQVNDVTTLQALVDKKQVVVTEATIREALHLDDEKGVECLPNEEIFAELSRMGYEKPSTKLTFYKAFFSSRKFNSFKYIFDSLVRNVDSPTKFYMYPCFLQLMIRKQVGKGFSRAETPLFESMLVEQQVDEEGDADENVKEVNAGDVAKGDVTAAHGEVPTADEEPSIPSPTPPTLPPQPSQDIPSTSQGRMIAEMDQDTDVVLEDDKEGRTTESQAEIYKIDLDHANKVLSMQEDKTEPTEVQEAELNKNIDWDEAIDHVKKKAKEDLAVKRYQLLKRKPQTEAQARKNMMAKFNSNVAFLLKTKEQIKEDENRALKRLNETPTKRAAKRQKLDEEVEELKIHLQIVPNEDDDVYTEATSLARKEIFSTTKPKNFSDDFLLVILGSMFEKLDIHAQIWKTQRNVHGPVMVKGWKLLESCGVQIITFTSTQLILLVERKYPLTRFTLDQMMNAVRLKVKEESEVYLELLRFTRQQQQEGQLE